MCALVNVVRISSLSLSLNQICSVLKEASQKQVSEDRNEEKTKLTRLIKKKKKSWNLEFLKIDKFFSYLHFEGNFLFLNGSMDLQPPSFLETWAISNIEY